MLPSPIQFNGSCSGNVSAYPNIIRRRSVRHSMSVTSQERTFGDCAQEFTPSARGRGPPSPLLANEPIESFEVTRLRGLGRPRLEVIGFHRRGEFRRPAEESPGFGGVKAGKTGCFEKCGLPVGGLDQRFNWRGRGGGEPEAQVDGR